MKEKIKVSEAIRYAFATGMVISFLVGIVANNVSLKIYSMALLSAYGVMCYIKAINKENQE